MSSEKGERKKEKKLRKFQDKEQTPLNRIKFLAEFTERCTDNLEIDAAFKAHHFEIVSLAHEYFVAYELSCKKGKTSEQTMVYLLTVMKRIMIHLQTHIAQRGGARTFVRMLETMLSTNQKHSIRTSALEILLLFYEALGDPEKEFVALLPAALDMTPFLPDFPGDTRFRVRPLPGDTTLVPRDVKSPYTKEESLDLINLFLNFISQESRLDKFQQWFGFLRSYILPTLYPVICKQMGLIDAADDTGFIQHCPYEIQSSLIDFLEKWTGNEALSAFLWGEQAAIMLEIYRQACIMPASRHENIKKALFVFKDSLFYKVPKTINENLLVAYRKWYWEKLTWIVPDSTLNQDHYKLIAESLNLYDQVVADLWTTLSSTVQEIILITALELTTRSIKRPDTGGVDRNLCPVLVEGLLLLWINAKVTDPNLWRALQERLRTFFHRKDAIAQCKFKLIQLTLVMENFMFTFDNHNKYEAKKAKQQTKRSESTFPDPVITFDARADPVIKEKDWDWNSAQLVWFNILEIFRYTNGLEDPGAYLESMDALTTAAEMILSAYERSDFEEPEISADAPPGQPPPPSPSSRPSLSLISIFGPWLFEAIKRPIVYADGKALAGRTLCRIILRQSHINLPVALLSHFYDAVQLSLLEFSSSKAAFAILEHSTCIFSLGLPGANILIPYYLTEITKIFTKVEHIPEKVRESAITILASLVCFPQHFQGLSIPFDSESAKHYKLVESIQVPGVSAVTPTVGISSNQITYQELKSKVANLLIAVVSREPKAQHVCMALSAISTLLIAEIHSPDAHSAELVLSLIKTVITCTLKEYRISHSALSCLAGLSSSVLKLHAIDSSIVSKICYQLVLNISTRQLSPGLELSMVAHYEALCEWMNCAPPVFYEDSKLIKKIFAAIEAALKAFDASGTSSGAAKKDESETVLSNSKQRLRRAAEQTLIYMVNFSNNWPMDRHYDILQSHIIDYIEELEKNNPTPSQSSAGGAGTQSPPPTDSDPLPPPPPSTSDVVSPSSPPIYVKDVLWYTMNDKYLISAFDHPFHSPALLDPNVHQALAYCLSSTHYIYFFRAFLRQYGLADAISLYYEDQQYQASGVDRTNVQARCVAFVSQHLAAKTLPLSPELSAELASKSKQSGDIQLWFYLYAAFSLFKNSPQWTNSQEHVVRLTTRDYSGKFTWDLEPCYDWAGDIETRQAVKESRATATVNEGNWDFMTGQQWRIDETADSAVETSQTLVTDFEHLLTTFKQNPFGNSPDIFAQKQLTDENHNMLLEFAEAMSIQQGFVEAKLSAMTTEPNIPHSCEPPQPATILSHCHATRLFLKHFGWLQPQKYHHFTLLDHESSRFKRLIKQLDTNTYGHEVTKIGLVYVKDGQENERAMLRNEDADASALYKEFVEGMATIVNISKHVGYVGGLDRSGTVGTTLPYWRNIMTELAIHEVTRMPTVLKDPQQILKKRHVGNDIVHLIWSEHCRDYKPQTIVSQFNDAHIMIFPLPNGLFRVKVAQKREVAPFGPLIHNMAIGKELLPLLAKHSAITANSVVRSSQEAYLGQFSARKNGVTEMTTKNARPAYSDYVFALFPAPEVSV